MSDAWKMNGNDDEKMGNERLKRRPGDVITVLRDGSVDLPASTFEEPPDFVNRLGGEIDASGERYLRRRTTEPSVGPCSTYRGAKTGP